MSYVMVDVESDGPVPPLYSMVCFGAVIVDSKMDKTFYGATSPISEKWIPEALAISGFTRQIHEQFDPPESVMEKFANWLSENSEGRPMFISDNNGFDFSFINFYFHRYIGQNPFGFSSTNLGSLYKGCVRNPFKNFKHLRKTKHDHNPLSDALGNVEALLQMNKDFNLHIKV